MAMASNLIAVVSNLIACCYAGENTSFTRFLHTSFPATSTDCEVAFMWQRAIVRMNSKISHPCHSLTEFATTEGLGVRNRPPRRTGLARTVEVQDEDE